MNSLKNPIEYRFDLNTKSQPKTLCVTHTDDNDVDVIKLIVTQGGNTVDLSQTIVTARMVMRWTHELLNDNVSCEYDSETGSIMIPIDNAVIPMRAGEMLVEVNILSAGADDKSLSLQFPLIVRVNGSILNNAEVTPDSRGTIPELLEEVEQELERVQGFATEAQVFEILDNALSGNRNISPTLLVDNVVDETHNPNGDLIMYYIDSDDVRHNIFDFSPYLGTDDYNELSNRPTVEGITANGAEVSTTLAGRLKLNALNFSVATIVNGISLTLGKNVFNCNMAANASFPYNFNMISNGFDGAGVYKIKSNRATNKPSFMNFLTGDFYVVHFFMGEDNTSLIRWVIGTDSNDKIVIYIQSATITPVAYSGFSVINQSAWQEIGEKGDPGATGADGYSPTATVTQTANGATVSITDKNGTTTANISNGVNGSDYILTAQDKSDIANIVLGLLPTTQGVQYGNQSN